MTIKRLPLPALGLALLTLGLGGPPRLTIRVYPRVLLPNNAVRVTCRVPRHPDNRWLSIGLTNYRSSTIQLDGDRDYVPVTTEITYDHVPCDVDAGYCEVGDNRGQRFRAVQSVTVSCSE